MDRQRINHPRDADSGSGPAGAARIFRR
jgi:hypothetical protein